MNKHDIRFMVIVFVFIAIIGGIIAFGSGAPIGMAGLALGSDEYCDKLMDTLQDPGYDSYKKAKVWETYDEYCNRPLILNQ